MSAQSAEAALPRRQTFFAPKWFSIMWIVRRAILRISYPVGGLGCMSRWFVEEMSYHGELWPTLMSGCGMSHQRTQAESTGAPRALVTDSVR